MLNHITILSPLMYGPPGNLSPMYDQWGTEKCSPEKSSPEKSSPVFGPGRAFAHQWRCHYGRREIFYHRFLLTGLFHDMLSYTHSLKEFILVFSYHLELMKIIIICEIYFKYCGIS